MLGFVVLLPGKIKKDERANEMSEAKHFTNFRIWAAVGTAVLYVFLAATGKA